MKSIPVDKRKKIVRILLFLIISLISFSIAMKELRFESSDFWLHMTHAVNFKREFKYLFTSVSDFPFQLSYPLWHILVNLCYKVSRIIFKDIFLPQHSAALVTALVNGCVYLLQEKYLNRYGVQKSELISFGLCFVMPITFPELMNRYFYFGQASPVTWHNPTNMIVKIFTLAGFFLISQILLCIGEGKTVPRRDYLKLTGIIFLSVLAKPSFFQGIVPTLGLFILLTLLQTKFSKFYEYCLLCGCFIPGFLLILGQYLISFYIGNGGEGIGIGWMEVGKVFYIHPLMQLFMTLIFPVCYILFNLNKVWKSLEIRLSVLYVIITWLEFALLYEKGPRKYDGNFEWALCLAYTVIWLVTSISFFRNCWQIDPENKRDKIINLILFLIWFLHVIFGILFIRNLFSAEKFYF